MDLPSQDMATNATGTVDGSVFLGGMWVGRQSSTLLVSNIIASISDLSLMSVQSVIFQRIVWGNR